MDQANKLRFKDTDGKREVVLFYRDPSVDDWISYQAKRSVSYTDEPDREAKFKKIYRAQFEAGREILTGFSAAGDGVLTGISQEDPDWKEKLAAKIPQFILALGRQVFEMEDLDAEKNF